MATGLLLIVLSLVVNDVEELELVDAARGRDDAEPVAELHLLEELLGPGRRLSVFRPLACVASFAGWGAGATYRYLR